MKITKQELIKMRACADGLNRFIDQTNDTDDSVEVISLIGGENTYEDLLWLVGKKFPKERIVRFACDCALLNIELIEPYTDKYDLIVEFLRNPTAHTGARAATHAARAAHAASVSAIAYAANAAANAATYAAIARIVRTGAARTAAIHAVIAAADADARDGNRNKVNELLRELFA